ncbi:MAG: flagellar hook-basal body complex protein FliE [Pseudolabrys sp.]|jgi:flagellar hook-basal body complex protein FliE|nr:flagellar hook-basal body complex protein FliE [Pseudolabrys sp.]
MSSPIAAANAYANIAKLGTDPSGGIGGIGAGAAKSEASFGSMLKDALDAVHETGRKSDAQSRAMVNGKSSSNMVDVVTSVAETEVAINAVVAVRDKVIAAYEEIMRMPI